MKKLLLVVFTLSLFGNIYIHGQSAQSDSLYAIGVDLYNRDQFQEAIPYFTECDRLDKAELAPENVRSEYAAMWLASCYRKMGDTEKANSISPASPFEPVDRRLTVESDSLAQLANNSVENLPQMLTYLRQGAAIEALNLGRAHYFRARSLEGIIYLETLLSDFNNLKETLKELSYVCQHCRSWRMDPDVLWFAYQALTTNLPEEEASFIDMMLEILEPSKCDEFDSDYDGFYGMLVSHKNRYLREQEDYVNAFKFCKEAYESMSGCQARNRNAYEVTSTYGTSAYVMFILGEDKNKKKEMEKLRIQLYDELLALSLELYGKPSFEYAQSLFKKANLYCGMGLQIDKAKGKALLHETFDMLLLPEICMNHEDEMSDILRGAESSFGTIGDSESLSQYVNSYLNMKAEDMDPTESMQMLADKYKDDKNYPEAIKIYDQLYTIYEAEGAIDECIETNASKAFCQKITGNYEAAITTYQTYDSLFNLLENKSMDQWYFYADEIMDFAQCYWELGDTINYIQYYNRASGIIEQCLDSLMRDDSTLGNTSRTRATIKINLLEDYGMVCLEHDFRMKPRYSLFFKSEKAKKYTRLAEQACSESSFPEDEKLDYYIQFRNRLGNIYTYEANFDSAYYYYNWIVEHADFSQYGRHISIYNDIASLYERVSIEPEISLQYRQKSLSLMADMLINHSNSISHYAGITLYDTFIYAWEKSIDQFKYLEDYEGMFRCYDELLSVIAHRQGTTSEDYIKTKTDMFEQKALYYAWKLKDNVKGQAYCDSIKDYYERNKNILKDDPFYNYSNVARHYYYCDDTIKAEYYFNKYEKQLKKQYPKNYKQQKEYIDLQKDKADWLHGGAKHITMEDVAALYKAVPDFKNEYFTCLLSMAWDAKDLTEKEKLYEELLQLVTDWDVEGWYVLYHGLIDTYLKLKEYEKIIPIYVAATEFNRRNIFEKFANATEQDREYFWKNVSKVPFTLAEPLYQNYPGQIPTSIIYDNLLLRKNFLLSSSIGAINFIREEGDTLLIAKYNRALALREALRKSQGDSIQNNGQYISRRQAQALIDRFDSEVMERVAVIGDYMNGLNIRWQDIQQHLDTNDIAIEFSCYENFDGQTWYAATLLRNAGEPIFVPLCDEQTLNTAKQNCYASTKLSNVIWKPLATYLQNAKNVYFSLDGQLHNLAIESIPYWNDDKRIMSDQWNLVRLSSTREIAMAKATISHRTATLYGDIRYGVTPEKMQTNHAKYKDADWSGAIAYARSIISSEMAKDLPGTKAEIEAIAPILRGKNIEVQIFTADTASEESFKSLSGTRQNIIHIGTHGFYRPDTTYQHQVHYTPKELRMYAEYNDMQNNPNEDPLNRCGLLFAGANTALAGDADLLEENVQDGILTAKEISLMDLRGTDIVVLSACETALGDITGEGVFGLQRGFKKAGAQTILMSLWKVDDAATQQLMTSFYRHYAQGLSKREAFRRAQQDLRHLPPYYWAGFILLD